jgi:hypothetical protein
VDTGPRVPATNARLLIALAVALIGFACVVLLSQQDFVAADPLWYAGIAKDPGQIFHTHELHPFVMRIGLTLPLALIYRTLGVSTWTTNLPALLSALAIIAIVYAAAPTPRAKLVGLVFAVTCVPLLRHGSLLNVDLPCSAAMAASVLCLARRDRPRGAVWLVGAVAAWFFAFLVKESAIWLAPVWIYALVVDFRQRRLRAYIPAVIVGAALAACYLAFCAHYYGTPLARFKGVEELTYEHAWTLHGRPASDWIKRLTYQPAVMVAKMFSILLIPAVLAPWLVGKEHRIWLVTAASAILLYWFGSVSLTAYTPMPLTERMVLPVLPAMLVCASLGADAALDRLGRWTKPVAIGFALVVVLPAAVFVARQIRRPRPETHAFALLRAEASSARDTHFVIVCGEPRCVPIANFYFGLQLPPNVSVAFANDWTTGPPPTGAKVRALVHVGRAAIAHRIDPALDRTAPIEALGLPHLYVERSVHLFDAGDGTALWTALRATP